MILLDNNIKSKYKCIKQYYEDGTLKSVLYMKYFYHKVKKRKLLSFNKNMFYSQYHRSDGPAYIRYNEDGSIRYVSFYLKGIEKTLDDFLKETKINDTIKVEIKLKYYHLVRCQYG